MSHFAFNKGSGSQHSASYLHLLTNTSTPKFRVWSVSVSGFFSRDNLGSCGGPLGSGRITRTRARLHTRTTVGAHSHIPCQEKETVLHPTPIHY